MIKRLVILNIITLLLIGVLPKYEKQVQIEEKPPQIAVVEEKQDQIEVKQEIENLSFTYEKNLLEKSNIKVETLEQAFAGTQMAGLGQYFVKAEQETGVNALYLAGLACHESGWNTSEFAQTRNNLFGWQSYDSNLNATKKFETKEQGILFVAKCLKKSYLSENGIYHNGYTIESISKRYASDTQHSKKVYKNIQKLLDKVEKM